MLIALSVRLSLKRNAKLISPLIANQVVRRMKKKVIDFANYALTGLS